jgi:hypothetical protein
MEAQGVPETISTRYFKWSAQQSDEPRAMVATSGGSRVRRRVPSSASSPALWPTCLADFLKHEARHRRAFRTGGDNASSETKS